MSRAVEGPTGDLLEALGTVVLNFSGLEESLRDAIYLFGQNECASDGRTVSILTARLSFRTLVDTFGALCKDLDVRETPGGPVKFCSHLNKLNEKRNVLIHSVWNLRPDNTPRRFKRTAKPKSGFQLTVTKTNAEEVLAFAFKLSDAEKKVWEFVP